MNKATYLKMSKDEQDGYDAACEAQYEIDNDL
jgi:hypothetical protein